MYIHSDNPTGLWVFSQMSTTEYGRLPLCVLYRPGGLVVITLANGLSGNGSDDECFRGENSPQTTLSEKLTSIWALIWL